MRNHCLSKHKLDFDDIIETVQKRCRMEIDIAHYTKKVSLAEILPKLVAVDGFSFYGIIKVNL